MTGTWPWYTARAAGMVAWSLLALTVGFGLLRSTGIVRHRARPAWVVDLHRFLGALTVVFTVVHVVAILADTDVHFSPAQVLVPFTSRWHPVAVAWGTVALYLLAAVELTSLARRRLPYRLWRRIHVAALPLFALATIHGLSAGTDRSAIGVIGGAVALSTGVACLMAVRLMRIPRANPQAGSSLPTPRVVRPLDQVHPAGRRR